MTQRFGGIFSNLSQRDFVFLDSLILEIPLTGNMYEETNLHAMSDLEIISMLDEYIDTLSNMMRGRGRYSGSEEWFDTGHMPKVDEYLEGWRRAYPKVVALRHKLARKAGIS